LVLPQFFQKGGHQDRPNRKIKAELDDDMKPAILQKLNPAADTRPGNPQGKGLRPLSSVSETKRKNRRKVGPRETGEGTGKRPPIASKRQKGKG